MKIVVFGSTGGTGREVLKLALEQGYTVTAFARDPDKLSDLKHETLTVVKGDVLDPVAVEQAVEGQEAVVSALGAGSGQTTLRYDGTRTIVDAMQRFGVRRLISVSSLGVGESQNNFPLWIRILVIWIILRSALADHERQEGCIKQSDLEWTIVRPGGLTNESRTGSYRYGFPPTDQSIMGRISRADVADFILKELKDPNYIRQTPGLSY